MAINRLNLKVGIIFDKKKLQEETLQAQKQLDKVTSESIKKQQKLQDTLSTKAKKSNKDIKQQTTLVGKLRNIFSKTASTLGRVFVLLQGFRIIAGIIRDAIGLAFELDTAFTNFAIVSKATAEEIENVNEQVNGLTLELGKLKKEVIDTVTEFTRAGFSIQESLTLAENAIKGANVGATELSNVTTFLIAGLKAFNLEAEDSARILDVLFRVANTTAINLEGIGEAFLRSANTLQTAGASLEEASALIAGANESIQDPAKVGTALKTIASRLRGVSEDGEAIPKLAESFNAVGISIQEADGSFRNIFDIFQDLARILPTLDELTRESLLEKLAGKRQKNIIIGLLNNFDTAEQALKDALNSTGEVAEANEKFLDSLQGRTNQLKEAWNQLMQAFTNSDVLKFLVSTLKNIVLLVTRLVTDVPNLAKAVVGLGLAFAPFGGVVTIIGAIVGGLGALGTVLDIVTKKTETSRDRFKKYNDEISELNGKIADLEAIENRTDAEKELLAVYEEQLAKKKELANQEALIISKEELENTKASLEALSEQIDGFKEATDDADKSASDLEDTIMAIDGVLDSNIDAINKQKIAFLEAQVGLDSTSESYKNYQSAIELLDQALIKIGEAYNQYGIRVNDANIETDKANEIVAEQISLLQQSRDFIEQSSDTYGILSDALQELEETGSVTNDTLDLLIENFGSSAVQALKSKDAFTEYVDAYKIKSAEERAELRATAEESLRTAKARLVNFKSALLAGRISLQGASQLATFESAVKDAENAITLLELGEKQITATEKARKDSTSTTQKQIEVLSDLELKLKDINFQIEAQKRLFSRTDDEQEQIAINERLIELYQEQKDALIEQQKQLEEQNKGLKNGQEGFEEYVDEGIKLSLAIEDATNSIFDLTKANGELNKSIAESKLNKLTEDLDIISERINESIQDQIDKQKELAEVSEKYYDGLIKSKEDELQALKDANEERENQVRLEELLQNLQDLRERRNNILAQKNKRIVKDAEVGFEFISDEKALDDIEGQIADAEKAIQDFRREQIYDENVRRIESEIETLETIAENEQEAYSTRIDELNNFQNEVNTLIENGGQVTLDVSNTIQESLKNQEVSSYGLRLNELQTFVNAYNAKMATLNAQKANIQSIENSIQSSLDRISATRNAITNTLATNSTSRVSASTPNSSSVAKKITNSGITSSGGNSTTTINKAYISSGAKTLDGVVRDIKGIANFID